MKIINLLANFVFDESISAEKDKEVREIFSGSRRRIIEIKLQNNAILPKHKAIEPITVFCLAGSGTFRAGKDLKEEMKLQTGTFLTLEAEVEHEIIAEPAIKLLVTKYLQD